MLRAFKLWLLCLIVPAAVAAQVVRQGPIVSGASLDTVTVVLPALVSEVILLPISPSEILVKWVAVGDVGGRPASYWVSIHTRGPIPVRGTWGAAPAGTCAGLVSGVVAGTVVECVAGGLAVQTVYDFLIAPVADTATSAPFPDLQVTTSSLPRGQAGVPYNGVLRATGGDGTYCWRIVSGSLPDGLTLDGGLCEIRGVSAGR